MMRNADWFDLNEESRTQLFGFTSRLADKDVFI